MKLTTEQHDVIVGEIDELTEVLIQGELSDGEKQGHYERVIELAKQTIESEAKELSLQLLSIGLALVPQGEELGELNDLANALPDEETQEDEKYGRENRPKDIGDENAEDQETGESKEKETVEPTKLKRSIDDIQKELKAKSKDGKVKLKYILRTVCKDNDISYDSKDNNTILHARIANYLSGTEYVEVIEEKPARKEKKEVEHNVEAARILVKTAADYVEILAKQCRAVGKDSGRFVRCTHDLNRIIRQRLRS